MHALLLGHNLLYLGVDTRKVRQRAPMSSLTQDCPTAAFCWSRSFRLNSAKGPRWAGRRLGPSQTLASIARSLPARLVSA